MSKFWISRPLGYAAGIVVSLGLFQGNLLFFLPLAAMFAGCFALSQIIAHLFFPAKWMEDRVGSETGAEMETFFSKFHKWKYGEVILAVALTLVHFQVLIRMGLIGRF